MYVSKIEVLTKTTISCITYKKQHHQKFAYHSLLQVIFYKAHSYDLSGHPDRNKAQATFTENYYFPNINTWIAILLQDCLNCQTSKSVPNLLMAPQQQFQEVLPYFNHRISMDTKSPISPSSDGNACV